MDDDGLDDLEDVDWLWEEYRAAVIIRNRVNTPEVRAEVERAKKALVDALEEDL